MVLRTWRAMCPALQERWPEAARPEHWAGVVMENGRVVRLTLEGFGLTGAVPAELGRLSALRKLWLSHNQLTSLPAEIGQLTSLRELWLHDTRLTSVPAAIHELGAAGCYVRMDGGVTVDEGDDASVLRTWRAMCRELQWRWLEASPAEHWQGVTMKNGRINNF